MPLVGYRSAMRLNPVLAELGSYPIADIKQRVTERVEAGLPVIDFSIGDPIEPTPQAIVDAMRGAIPEVSQYPTAAGRRDLREAVAAYVARRFGVTVDPDTQVIPTSGSKEAIFSTPFAFVESGSDEVVVYPSPGYPVYERGARFAGAHVAPIVLGSDFVMRADDIDDATWQAARLVWICTPHNPAGSVTTIDELAALLERARREDALLLSDECYADIYDDEVYPDGPPSVLQVAGDGARGTLAYLSLSKRSGMTGYRSGAIVGDAEAIAALRSLRSTTGTASPDFTQQAAVAAWSDDAHAAERRAVFAAKRAVLEKAFADMGMRVVASRAGLYLWVAVDDDVAVTRRLLDRGIVVSPGRAFGTGGENHIRLALVPGLEDCVIAANALTDALSR